MSDEWRSGGGSSVKCQVPEGPDGSWAGLKAGGKEVHVKRIALIAVMVSLVSAVGLAGCSGLQTDPGTTGNEPVAQTTAQPDLENVIWASGKLTPVLNYSGTPITARAIAQKIRETLDAKSADILPLHPEKV